MLPPESSPPLPDWARVRDDHLALPFMPHPESHVDWAALGTEPVIDPSAWVAPGAVVLGRVRLQARSSIWYGCVLRGDGEYIDIGEETNIQDGSILHIDWGYPCILGNRVSVGHRAVVHASVVEDGALIGIGAIVLSRCVIGAGALIAAGALVKEGTHVPPQTLWAGVPAKQVAVLTAAQIARVEGTWRHYVDQSRACAALAGQATP